MLVGFVRQAGAIPGKGKCPQQQAATIPVTDISPIFRRNGIPRYCGRQCLARRVRQKVDGSQNVPKQHHAEVQSRDFWDEQRPISLTT
jgi:hypothetical protein